MKKEIVIMIFAVIIVAIVFFSKQIKTAVNSFTKPAEITQYAIGAIPAPVSHVGMNLGLPEYAPAPLATYADASGKLVVVPSIALPSDYTVQNNQDGSVTLFPAGGGSITAPNLQAGLFAARNSGMLT